MATEREKEILRKYSKKGEVATATKQEVTPYMREKIPLIMSRLREAQKTMMVSKETLYEWLHPYITKTAFDEIIAYLERKGEIFEPRPGFLKTTESSSPVTTSTKALAANVFEDTLLGKCQYQFFYITNNLYGGYSAHCERGSISVDYADPREVVNMAEKSEMVVNLAGEAWKEVGKIGFGEIVYPPEARDLIKKLAEKRGFSPHHSSSTVMWHGASYYAYGSIARPLDWLTIRSVITSVPHPALVRLSRAVDYAEDEPYFNVLLSPQPLKAEEIKGLELVPLEKMPRAFPETSSSPEKPKRVYISPTELIGLPKEAARVAEERPPAVYTVIMDKGLPRETTATVIATSDAQASSMARERFFLQHHTLPQTVEVKAEQSSPSNPSEKVEITYLDPIGRKHTQTMTIAETVDFYQRVRREGLSVINVKKLKE